MDSLLLSRRDVDFLLFEWLDVTRLTRRSAFADHSRETFDAALDTYSEIAHAQFAPHNKKVDREPPRLVDEAVAIVPEQRSAYRAFAAAGLLAACQQETLGGMRLPYVVERAGLAFVLAACPATAAYAFLTIANANLLLTYGTPSQVARFVRPMLEGKWTGTMCLSEPHAGSSLADIATRAQRQHDGSYRLTGNKMWISGGDHNLTDNIVHLVLAKVPDERGALRPGVAGISLFVVPKYLPGPDDRLDERNDVVVAGLNHKMGYRGTANCLLNFGEGRHRPGARAGAVGELIGEEGRGLSYMFHMMNEARITVGLCASAIGYAGYLHAVDYARSRRQGRPPGQRAWRRWRRAPRSGGANCSLGPASGFGIWARTRSLGFVPCLVARARDDAKFAGDFGRHAKTRECLVLSRCIRSCRGRVAVARSGSRCNTKPWRTGRCVLSRQTRSLPILLSVGAAANRSLARTPPSRRSHDTRRRR